MNNINKPSLKTKKKSTGIYKKALLFVVSFIFLFTTLLLPVQKAKASGMPVVDIVNNVWSEVKDITDKLWRKGGALAFQQTLRSALNKMAYDTANWVGSGGEGQKPLFVTQDWGSYMAQIGDEAAGTYLENFSANFSESRDGSGMTMNFCQPSSIDVKLKISMGLSQQNRPKAPACTATKMISNWSDAAKKYADFEDPNFLDKFVNIFDPVSSDMGIYWEASTAMMKEKEEGEAVAKNTLLGKGGWLDPLKISGEPVSLPNQAKIQMEGEYDKFATNFNKYTGDAFIDAANIFLNQLAISSFNKLVQGIGKSTPPNNSSSLSGYEADPNSSGGETALKENTAKLIKPDFGVKSDYDILSDLVICPDPQNPGPTNCVIDNKFMQAITEQKTVAEALEGGYLNGSWQFETTNSPGSYQNNYSWRNVSILRKYRIVPVSWEEVFEKIDFYRKAADASPEDGIEKKRATLQDLVSCFSPYDEYNTFTNKFDATDQAWCTGLVDPSWVLKAPLNYCKKEGVGAQILNKYVVPSQPAYGSSPYIPSVLNITRATNYCADNQTCIKEAKDGTCLAYGYCNEEKRTWSFDSDTCEPIDNTCQAFNIPGSDEKIAYLQNTLDYEGCSADNAGCKQYSTYGAYNLDTGTVSWNANDSVYLNDKAVDCSSSDEGCTEILRVKPAWGANLVMNSSFVNDTIGDNSSSSTLNEWPVEADYSEIVNSRTEPGNSTGKAIKLEGSYQVSLYSDENNYLLPTDYNLVKGQAYTVSADIFIEEGDRAQISLGTGINGASYETLSTGSWRHVSASEIAGEGLTSPEFTISGYGNKVTIYIKNIKFEMAGWDTGYNDYAHSKSYQKIVPQYLEDACYVGETANGYSYQFKTDAPSQCNKYSRRCDQGEVGCELYTSLDKKTSVPAKVATADYCASECIGYDIYIAREASFFSSQAENLIPQTATKCQAEAVGCTEFTNLDDLSTGGESKEYYSALKHCVKPGQSSCSEFYAWEKTNNGSQLKLYTLNVDKNGAPVTVSDDSLLCNAEIFNAPINSPLYNADCREFYNTAGQIFYNLNSQVITCSDDCRSYRMTAKNYDNTIKESACIGQDKNWDNQEGSCVSCLNGGVWNNEHKACLYQGIPGEGKGCSASENGCREYNGSAGNNVRLISSYNFEYLAPVWTSNCDSGISLADVSNDKDGKSLFYNNNASSCSDIGTERQTLAKMQPLVKQIFAGDNMAAQLKVGNTVTEGKAYNVKFWASSAAGANVKMYLYNTETGSKSEFNGAKPVLVKGGSSWQIYSMNLEELDHEVSNNEILVMTADSSFYLDNFILTEITDRYYLIKSSSQIPNVCYYDIFDKYQGPDYNLGCTAYQDRAGNQHNLHNFSDICSSSAVGCEQVILTNNYNSYQGNIWGDDNEDGVCDSSEEDCLKIDRDKAMYVVYDSSKICNRADLGCSLMGEAAAGSYGTAWSDVFKKNNPNDYDSILCDKESAGCEKWQHEDGAGYSYFRDPGTNFCVYRTSNTNPSGEKLWYKSETKRCDRNSDGVISGGETSSPACLTDRDCGSASCIVDNNDYACPVSYLETVGYGGEGGRVPVPSESAGLCSATSSGCTEYIDSVSKFNPDLVFTADGNDIKLEPYKMYVMSIKDENGRLQRAELRFNNTAAPLLSNNKFRDPVEDISIGGREKTAIFNSLESTSAELSGDKNVTLRELAIAYQINSEVDKTSCNGLVNFDNGCILFNERSVSGAPGLASLENGFDPYLSKDGSAPVNCSTNNTFCGANQLIKVRPDRQCATWLSCSTYSIDSETGREVCYDLKQCNSLSQDGKCNNFLPDTYKPNTQNATGYSISGLDSISEMKEVGLNTNAHFSFEELIPSLSCERKDAIHACSYDQNIVKDFVVREPDKARIDYPAAGKSYLRIPSAFKILPLAENSFINLSSNREYYLSYLVNTKNASGQAVVQIRSGSDESKSVFATSTAPHGWERKIHKFDTGNSGIYDRVTLLLSSDSNGEGEVYFDDINIEPVLETSSSTARYASRECRLYPHNDSFDCRDYNTNVISEGLEGYCLEHDRDNKDVCQTWYPVDRISSSLGGSSLGYSGPNGLSYCTNVKSNVKFVKKISTNLMRYYINEDGPDSYCGFLNNVGVYDNCGDYINYDALFIGKKQRYRHERVYCIPKQDKIIIPVGQELTPGMLWPGTENIDTCKNINFYQEGWLEYDGKFHQQPVIVCDKREDLNHECYPINEYTNATPPIRVYDNNYQSIDEQGLQYLSADSGDRDKVFKLTCDQFTQVVSNSGDNMAWTVRTSSAANQDWAYHTPYFFNEANSHNIQEYGRQRNGIPYGAATFDATYDLLNSGPVYLQNQYYQKDKETIFGGRPYGCEGESCANIGYCSDNPSVMCLYYPSEGNDKDYINVSTCSDGGFGVCEKLWDLNLDGIIKKATTEDTLSQIFKRSYGSYTFQQGNYTPTKPLILASDFKGDPPTISNIGLYLNNNLVTNLEDRPAGVYALKFNSKVHPEQQPLNMLYIDWGDESYQAITGIDHRPDLANPHVFYHFYEDDPTNHTITINAWDNWGNKSPDGRYSN